MYNSCITMQEHNISLFQYGSQSSIGWFGGGMSDPWVFPIMPILPPTARINEYLPFLSMILHYCCTVSKHKITTPTHSKVAQQMPPLINRMNNWTKKNAFFFTSVSSAKMMMRCSITNCVCMQHCLDSWLFIVVSDSGSPAKMLLLLLHEAIKPWLFYVSFDRVPYYDAHISPNHRTNTLQLSVDCKFFGETSQVY